MQVIISNKIKINNFDNYAWAFCKNNLEFDNPDFIKKQEMGKWTGSTPRKIVLYEKVGNDLIIPFGCFRRLWNDLKHNPNNQFISNLRKPEYRINYQSNIKPYSYQEIAIQKALQAKNGVLVMPCGSGKTQTALEIIARLGLKTLWLTHTSDLLNQSLGRAKSCFGLELGSYGTITGGKVDVGKAITFATVQTMANINLETLKDYFDVVVVDECHKCVGTPTNIMMFYKVVSALNARYKFGLTATPKRADNLQNCMFAILGDVIYEVPKTAVACTTCEVRVRKIPTNFTPDLDIILASDGTLIFSSLVQNIVRDKTRNEQIVNDLKNLDGATLILSDRVEHLDTLHKMLGSEKSSIIKASNTKADKEKRKTQLADLNEGRLKYLFATYKLAKEGLDIPNLRYVVFATPQKDETTVTQSAGRVGRKSPDKQYGVVIDYIDSFGLLKNYSFKRNKIYKKLGYIC